MHPKLELFLRETAGVQSWWRTQATGMEGGKAVLELCATERASIVLQIASGLCEVSEEIPNAIRGLPGTSTWAAKHLLQSLLDSLLRLELPIADKDIPHLIACLAACGKSGILGRTGSPATSILRALEIVARKHPLSEAHSNALSALLERETGRQHTARERKILQRVRVLAGGTKHETSFPLEAGEPWADRVIEYTSTLAPDVRESWIRLLDHARSASGSKPSGTWNKRARQLIVSLGVATFLGTVDGWFALVGQPGAGRPMRGFVGAVTNPTVLSESNADVLKGLAWCVGAAGDPSASRALADLAEVCFKKIPVHGARCPRVGNACLVAMNLLPGPIPVGELGRLRSRVKQPSIRTAVEKAIKMAADALGMPPEEAEEMSVPNYGLGSDGSLTRRCGAFAAELSISGTTSVAIRWTSAAGKSFKSPPAEVKRDHAAALKDLQRTFKEVQKMLPAQVQRIEQLLLDQRDWPLNVWRERYLDHPLASQICRRLIWQFSESSTYEAIWHDGKFVGSDGRARQPGDDSRVRLWHPIQSSTEGVLAWRNWLEEHRLVQPFKQAHRELYLLTDAERQTATYSNRFAAHVLRQHQFAALCQARGWKYRLMGGFDSHNIPTLDLPRHDLRAEFWVEQPGQDELSPSGISLRIVTDQVRFYRRPAMQPLALEEVPSLVFSEILRNVDLFVGVASVGNDPTWQDGGPEGRYRTYWQNFSFGELSETANTRRAVLERLLPRLTKIRDRCTLSDRFLIVRGELRTYKIHLGSGNILMEPNNQYLCIVPSRSSSNGVAADVFLPFEGDATLSVILSKAFLLAADRKITDATITRQITMKT